MCDPVWSETIPIQFRDRFDGRYELGVAHEDQRRSNSEYVTPKV